MPGVPLGGLEHYALTIGLAAAAEGWDVHAAFPQTPETAELATAFREGGATTHDLQHRSARIPAWEVAKAARRMAGLVGRVEPDVVHANFPMPTFARGGLIGCAVRRVPTVAVFHLAPDGLEFGRSRRLYPAIRARGQVWVAVSKQARDSIVRSLGLGPEDVVVIRNGVAPVSTAPASPEERSQVRRSLGLPDSAVLALSVGRLSPEKGHADLIEAAGELADRFADVHYVIAGEGGERRRLEALVRERGLEGKVLLVGHRDDVDSLMRAADLFVFPSHHEGLPLALLEAAAHGLPIISSDVGDAAEVIAHGRSGLLHPPGDTESLRRCLELALGNPAERRAMGDEARSVVDRFSRDEMVSRTLAVLTAQARAR